MLNDLADPSDLRGFAGAPFTDAEADAAVMGIRQSVGWHIAPIHADTAVVLSVGYCQKLLRLPTRQLISVEEIRDAVADTAIADETYRVIRSRDGVLKTSGYWPHGLDVVEADFTHGYAECPADLLPVIAEAALLIRGTNTAASASTLTAGPFTMQFASASSLPLAGSDILDRYRLTELGIA